MKHLCLVFILYLVFGIVCSVKIPTKIGLVKPIYAKSKSLVFKPSSENPLISKHGLLTRELAIRGGSIDHTPRVNLYSVKIALQVFLTSFNALCWIIPLRSKRFTEDHSLLSLANCFAGGIFLMLSFGHLIPNSIHLLESAGLDGTNALLYSVLGYLIMFTVEKMAFNTHCGHSHHSHSHTSPSTMNSAKLLCIALCLHSFFEAASLGLSTDATSAYVLTLCIALHQPAESMALLVAFLKSNMSLASIAKWMLAYSGVTLLGQAAGQIVSRMSSTSMEAIVTAVTAGTFIYVGATEIANEEFEDVGRRTRIVRFLLYLLGMGTMLAIVRVSGSLGHTH